jgi:hypothetical protein
MSEAPMTFKTNKAAAKSEPIKEPLKGQANDVSTLITQLETVAGEVSGTISIECMRLAGRLSRYLETATGS